MLFSVGEVGRVAAARFLRRVYKHDIKYIISNSAICSCSRASHLSVVLLDVGEVGRLAAEPPLRRVYIQSIKYIILNTVIHPCARASPCRAV